MSFFKPNVGQEEAVKLDPGTEEIMRSQRARAGENIEQIANESLQGSEKGKEFLPTSQGIDQGASALAMAQPENLSKVLAERGQKYFGEESNKLRSQAKEGAVSRQQQRMKAAISPLEQQHQMRMQQYEIAKQNEQRKKAARGALLGNILGIAGAVGGAFAGSGNPKAIQGGMAAGSQTGEAIGGA